MSKNHVFREAARKSLSGRWGEAVVVTLVLALIVAAFEFIPMDSYLAFLALLSLLISVPLQYGYYCFFLKLVREEEVGMSTLFDGFKDYIRVFGTLLLMSVYVLLWTLCLIIPGIIKGFSYALTPLILADYPEKSFNEVIELSMEMMDGKKMQLFLLYLSFIGWVLLSILTLGIGFLWLAPYMETAFVHFYLEAKQEYEARDVAAIE